MEGTAKRQVNAEDMLAELKRAVKSSATAPDAPPPSASTAPSPIPRAGKIGDRKSTRKATAPSRRRRPQDRTAANLQKSTRPESRSWKPTAGGIVLAGAATLGEVPLMNTAPYLPEREPSVAATESPGQVAKRAHS